MLPVDVDCGGVLEKREDIRLKKNLQPPVVAIDLDGTLLRWIGWNGEGSFGEPLPGAREALEKFKQAGWHVIVWTCRENNRAVHLITNKYFPGLVAEVNEHKSWESKYGSPRKIVADMYIDDRAWPFCGQKFDWRRVIEDLENRGILFYD